MADRPLQRPPRSRPADRARHRIGPRRRPGDCRAATCSPPRQAPSRSRGRRPRHRRQATSGRSRRSWRSTRLGSPRRPVLAPAIPTNRLPARRISRSCHRRHEEHRQALQATLAGWAEASRGARRTRRWRWWRRHRRWLARVSEVGEGKAGRARRRALRLRGDAGRILPSAMRRSPRRSERIVDALGASGRPAPAMARLGAILRPCRARGDRAPAERCARRDRRRGASPSAPMATPASISTTPCSTRCSASSRRPGGTGAHLDPDGDPTARFPAEIEGSGSGSARTPRTASSRCTRQLAFLGLESHLDAVTFSAEVGWRKPSPRIFEAALRSTRNQARAHGHGGRQRGCRYRRRARGRHARACSSAGVATGGSGDADAVIAALRELPGALRDMGLYFE